MIWYVSTLSTVVLVEAPDYAAAKRKGQRELRERTGRKVVVATCRRATKDDISLHLLNSSVPAQAVGAV